jgi:hypothetical protein
MYKKVVFNFLYYFNIRLKELRKNTKKSIRILGVRAEISSLALPHKKEECDPTTELSPTA